MLPGVGERCGRPSRSSSSAYAGDLACAELERQGLQVLDRNWRWRLGEIDLVAVEAGATGLTLVSCVRVIDVGSRLGLSGLSPNIRSWRLAGYRRHGGDCSQCVRMIFAEDSTLRVEDRAVFGFSLLPPALLAED